MQVAYITDTIKRHGVKIAAAPSTPTSSTSDSQIALPHTPPPPQPQLTASSAAIAAARAAAIAAASSVRRSAASATTAGTQSTPKRAAAEAAAADVSRQAMTDWAGRDPTAEEAAQPRTQHSTDNSTDSIALPSTAARPEQSAQAQAAAASEPQHYAQTDTAAAAGAADNSRPSQGPVSVLQHEAAWEEEHEQELQLSPTAAECDASGGGVTNAASVNLSAKTGLAGLASAARM